MSEGTYRVVVTREDDAWLADVPDLPGAHTYARNLPSLDQSVREVIAMIEDLPDGAEANLRLTYEYRTGDSAIDETTSKLRAERERIRRDQEWLVERTIEVARDLVARHRMSVRDAAALLSVAPQRISQVAPTGARRTGKAGQVAKTTTRRAAVNRAVRNSAVRMGKGKSA